MTAAGDIAATLERLRTRLDPLETALDVPMTTAAEGAAMAGGPPPQRSDYDLNAALRRGAPGPLAPAAVLAPLVVREGALWLVFTERAAHLKRHAGQISFPGGRRDPGDPDLAAAALREAHEEIGLDPAAVELLGAFDAYETITGYAITPFVGLVRGDFVPVPDPSEVADVFEAPLSFLMDPANHRRGWREWRGERRYFYEMPYGGRRIWGATAGLLKSLHDRLYSEPA